MSLTDLLDPIIAVVGRFAVPATLAIAAILGTIVVVLRTRTHITSARRESDVTRQVEGAMRSIGYEAGRQRAEQLEATRAQVESLERMRAEIERQRAEQLEAMHAQVQSLERMRAEFERQRTEQSALRAKPVEHSYNSVSAPRDSSRPRHGYEPVECSIFAPPEVQRRAQFTIQAIFHLKRDIIVAARLAVATDSNANRLASQLLEADVPHGATIEAFLECSALKITSPLQSVPWEGSPANMEFGCQLIQDDLDLEAVLHVSVDGVPVGEVEFEIEVAVSPSTLSLAASQSTATSERLESDFRRYRYAFISYSRKDFRDVSFFAQGLSENGQNLIIDVSDIEPGDEWEDKLDEFVREADVVYVMWSDNAAESKWVHSETKLAASLNMRRKRPAIKPIPLQQPWPKPPTHLSKYGFYSTWHAHRTAQALGLIRSSVE